MCMRTLQERAARRGRWLAALPLSLAWWLLAAHPAAAAGPPVVVSGIFAQTSFVQSNVPSADGVTVFDFTEQGTLAGSFTGTSVLEGSCVVPASGRGVCQARETFTGTVGGQRISGGAR